MKWLILAMLSVMSLAGQGIDQGLATPDCSNNPQGLPCSAKYTLQTLPIPTYRYGVNGVGFDYAFLGPSGPAFLVLRFEEPNNYPLGQRVFTVKIGDQAPMTIDIFKAVGQSKLLEVVVPVMIPADAPFKILFRPVTGKPLIADIRIVSMSSMLTAWLTCVRPSTDPRVDCTGLDYLVLKTATGDPVALMGVPAPPDFQPAAADWKPVTQ